MDEIKTISAERIARLEAQMDGLKDDMSELKQALAKLVQSNLDNSKDIMSKLENMEDRMERRIVESFKSVSVQSEKENSVLKEQIKDLQSRIGILEKWRWYLLGAVFAVSYILSNTSILKLFN